MNKIELVWSDQSLSVNFYGRITLQDLMKANDMITADIRMDHMQHYIIDMRYVSWLDVTDRELTIFSKYDAVMPRFLKRCGLKGAFIATSTAIEKQLNTFLKHGHRAWQRKVFCGDVSAKHWIDGTVDETHQPLPISMPQLQAIA